MRNFRFLFTFIAVLFIGTSLSAQDKKIIENAENKRTELNEQLVTIDDDLALTEEQSQMVYETYLDGLTEMKKARKAADTKEEGKAAQKAIRKAMNKKIRKEILTKEQRKALNDAKKGK